MSLTLQGNVPKSPFLDFSILKFGFDGVASAMKDDVIYYMVVQPQNYLEWGVSIML